MNRAKTVTVLTLLMLIFNACDPGEDSATIEGVVEPDVASGEFVVQLSADEGASYEACTDFVKFYKLDEEGESDAEPIESALIYPLDAWTGYFLDGEFVPPVAGMGCDVLSCETIDGYERTFALVDYEYVGDRILTTEEKEEFAEYYSRTPIGDNIPDTVAEYTSTPITGTIKMEVTHWLSDDCSDAADSEAGIAYTTEFIIE